VQAGVHYADCSIYEDEPPTPRCEGCAPAAVVDRLLLCDRCYRRTRGLLRNAFDLLARMRTLTGQAKAVVYSPVKVSSSRGSARDQVGSELLDAITEISSNLSRWSRYIDMSTLRGLDHVLTDIEQTWRLSAAVLDTHSEDDTGARHWSLADAAARWGIERRDRHVYPATTVHEDDVEEIITPITEWYDPILVARDAARRAGVEERQLRRWVQRGLLEPAAVVRGPGGTVTKWYQASAVDAAAEKMRDRRHAGVKLAPE
jgi:hypothetical protein